MLTRCIVIRKDPSAAGALLSGEPTANEVLQPVSTQPSDVKPFRGRSNAAFVLLSLVVHLVPRGKVKAAKYLGKRVLKPRGTARTSSGVAIAIDRTNVDSFGELMKRNGTMEEHVKGVCIRFLRDGDVFFDAGANIGYVALEVAAAFGSTVEVFAFEPQPALARNIAVSAELNDFPHVHVFAAMLGKTDDEATLFLSDDSIHASAVARREGAAALSCPRARIDTLVQSGVLDPPNVLKVDVEGGELDLFIGAATTIKEHPPVIVFEADDNCERFGYTPDDLVAFLRSLANYDFFSLTADGRLVERRPDDPSCRDLVAVPRGFESSAAARTSGLTVVQERTTL